MALHLNWIPWKFLLRRVACAYNVLDPIDWLAGFRRFAQPSEVPEPIDILRAGIAFHARGLINGRAIQHNLDWIWPYWVERQYKPGDISFIPRAFSVSHINLTHRNWTAVGQPDVPLFPLVDPRGLVTPHHNGWSLDAWLVTRDGRTLVPSRTPMAEQRLDVNHGCLVETDLTDSSLSLNSRVYVEADSASTCLVVELRGEADAPGWLVVTVRPYNPEGIQFVQGLTLEGRAGLRVNDKTMLHLDPVPERFAFSTYAEGDVFHKLDQKQAAQEIRCPVGMATGAVLYPLESGRQSHVRVLVDLIEDHRAERGSDGGHRPTWQQSLAPAARLQLPDEHMQYLYDTSLRSLILLSAGEIVPGPFTYRRFWYRDAVMMLSAMLSVNLVDRCVHQLNGMFKRQKPNGFFESQEGEWDSNGQVLWLFDRFQRAVPERFDARWMSGIISGAHWIRNKRLVHAADLYHGLLPAGFSAEHLGPNDHYYWDNFWSIAGLFAAWRLVNKFGDAKTAEILLDTARNLEKATFASISGIPRTRSNGAIPAAPYRRMDAGAIGSLVADYPLQLTPVGDAGISATVAYLMGHCFFKGGFFQEMTHSGINVYLTLAIAQSLLRNNDPRYQALMDTAAQLASGTGQWPEAVHPLTMGGCMGDGHHGWASAEWVMMIRNCFIREEKGALIIGSGLLPAWLRPGQTLFFGPTLTRFGSAAVKLHADKHHCRVDLQCHWNGEAPRLLIKLPGFEEKEMRTSSELMIRLIHSGL